MRYTDARLLDALASAYVLGTLEGGARRRFERLQHDRTDVRSLVAQWEQRLGQLALAVPVRRPSVDLWPAIAARTRPAAAREAPASRWTGWLRPTGFGLGGIVAGVVAASALFLSAPGIFISSETTSQARLMTRNSSNALCDRRRMPIRPTRREFR